MTDRHIECDIMTSLRHHQALETWCSADAKDIRVLDAYMDCIQKQYKNVSNNLMGLLLSLFLWELP
jgi:hypothetical protein